MKKYILLFGCILNAILAFSQEKKTWFDVARTGTFEEIKALYIENPNLINSVNKEGFSALVLSTYKKNNNVAKFLIENGAEINENTKMGSPLMAAVVKTNNEIALMLMQKKANVNSVDVNGTTALIYATMFKNYKLVSELVKNGADVDAKDNRKNSAIDYALLANDDKLMELLKNKNKKL